MCPTHKPGVNKGLNNDEYIILNSNPSRRIRELIIRWNTTSCEDYYYYYYYGWWGGGDIHKAYEIAFRIGVRCFLPPILDFVFEKLSFTFKGVVVAVAGISKKMEVVMRFSKCRKVRI